MDRDAFVTNDADGWWLVRDDLDYQLAGQREELGQALGRSDREWYKDLDLLLRFYQFLESNHNDLLRQLDEATDDSSRSQWLQEAIAAAKPEEESAATESEQLESEHPGAEDTGQWDENWQMLYRVGADGTYEFAESDDHVTVRPGASWMSQEEAASRQATAATQEVTEEVVAAQQEVLEQMKAEATDMAEELGMSEEEMAELANDPEFQQMLTEELQQAMSE